MKRKKKKCVKNLGRAVKNGLKGIFNFVVYFWHELDKITRDKKDAQVCEGRKRKKIEKSYKLKV